MLDKDCCVIEKCTIDWSKACVVRNLIVLEKTECVLLCADIRVSLCLSTVHAGKNIMMLAGLPQIWTLLFLICLMKGVKGEGMYKQDCQRKKEWSLKEFGTTQGQ